jgi:hypothetical protein
MGVFSEIDIEINQKLREQFDIDWDRFQDISRAALYELNYGPMGVDYWTYTEPLANYEWSNWNKAIEDLNEILQDLPYTIWYNYFDGSIYADIPQIDSDWDQWIQVDVNDVLFHSELRNYVN